MSFLNFILIVGVIGGNLLKPCASVLENPCHIDQSGPRHNFLTVEKIQNNIRIHLRKELDLSGKGIKCLDKNTFDNYTDITSLNLSNNEISELPALVFMKLTNLEHLSLANNDIKGTKNAFVGLSNLKTLDISGNPLTEILDDGCFSGLTISCNITIRGVSGVRQISTNAFGYEYRTEAKNTINNDNRNYKTKSESIYARSAPLGLRRNEDPNNDIHIQVCIEGNSVQRLDILESPENLTIGCKEVSTKFDTYDLSRMNISKFENGWYRLKDKNQVPFKVSAINLQDNNIVEVTRNIMNELPENIISMRLDNNKIERLEEGCFEHGHIFSLSLSRNSIAEIEKNAFKMPALYQLDLTDNRLKDTKFVSTLPTSLVSLELNANEITEISANSFSNLKELRYLSLRGNKLTVLQNQFLLGATSIQQLILNDNQITTVQSGAFENLNPFQISLNGNNISNFEKGTFAAISGLQVLNIKQNRLTKIEHGIFDQPRLRLLQLGGNNIKSIAKGAVKNLARLETLDISENPINILENGALFGLNKTAKVYVDVTGTPIDVIQGGLFDDV